MKTPQPSGPPAGPDPGNRTGLANRAVEARDLLGDHREIHILHDGARYVLRLTRQNKLILTK